MKYFSYLSKMLKVNPIFIVWNVCICAQAEARGQRLGVGSFFPPHGL